MPDDTPERDPARPTREELLETARSEGLMASEEETDPDFVDPDADLDPAGPADLGHDFADPPPDDDPDADFPTP